MSRYLLDTHTVLFWWAGSNKLGGAARATMSRDDSALFVSAASAWEIATKFRNGKLNDIGDPAVSFSPLMQRNAFASLPVTEAHALHAGSLPGKHSDPFDRIIAAQALLEDLIVIARDPEIAAFGCEVLW